MDPSAPHHQSTYANFYSLDSIYSPTFDLSWLPEDRQNLYRQHGIYTTFPVALVVLLHFLTLGLFTLIFFGLKHSRLPLIRSNDFGAGKAIGFRFIPFFNIYWTFVFWLRLADRINFQYRLRGYAAPRVDKGLVLTMLILNLIPYLNILSFFVFTPVVAGIIQSACNELARERQFRPFPM